MKKVIILAFVIVLIAGASILGFIAVRNINSNDSEINSTVSSVDDELKQVDQNSFADFKQEDLQYN